MSIITNQHFHYLFHRTKWKRQTAVGLELLAEAGNYAAFQRLYGNPAYLGWPYQGPPGSAPSVTDLYYRQAAAAAALQKPLPYRLYPTVGVPVAGMAPAGGGAPFSHLSASSSLTSLSNYYQSATNGTSTGSSLKRSPSPPLNPGSPETRPSTRSPPVSADEDEAIQV